MQKNAHTVQQELNSALGRYCGYSLETVGSGRTDTGVHARQQFCHVDLADKLDKPLAMHKINAILPQDISVMNIFEVSPDAHARFDAVSRSYTYHLHRHKDPFRQYISYYFRPELDLSVMNKACQYLLAENNFQSFSRVKTSVENFNCRITSAEWTSDNAGYTFYVSANRFLRGMVRALVGTMLDLGTGKLSVDQFRDIMKSGDRKKAGRAVPAHGLFLTRVEYPAGLLKQ